MQWPDWSVVLPLAILAAVMLGVIVYALWRQVVEDDAENDHRGR